MIREELFVSCIESLDETIRNQKDPSSAVTALIVLLGDLLYDTHDWVGYYCFDLDFGRRWKPGCVKNGDGEDIPLRNPHELYRFLSDNMLYELTLGETTRRSASATSHGGN